MPTISILLLSTLFPSKHSINKNKFTQYFSENLQQKPTQTEVKVTITTKEETLHITNENNGLRSFGPRSPSYI